METKEARTRQIRKRIWDGQILVQIELQVGTSVNASVQPWQKRTLLESELLERTLRAYPLYLLAWRCSYLPQLLPSVKAHFGKVVSAEFEKCSWSFFLASDDTPFPWNYPIGLMFDLDKARRPSSPNLPWRLILRAEKEEVPSPSLCTIGPESSDLMAVYFSALKQADAMQSGSAKSVMNLAKSDQLALWDGVVGHSFEKFWAINKELTGMSDPKQRLHVPLKLYMLASECERWWKVEQVLLPLADSTVETISRDGMTVVLHGIALSQDTPLSWLAQNCAYPDNFLHLILQR